MGMKRWIMPKPPLRAIYIAIRDYVTVSIGEDTMGIFNGTFWENRD
jgi:hypothetical protein